MKTRYKFSHRSDDGRTYYWVSQRIWGSSTVEQICCSVASFWNVDWTSND